MNETIHQPDSKVRVIRSKVVEEHVEDLYLPSFNFHKDQGPRVLADALERFLGTKAQEELWVLYFNGGDLLAVSQVHIGTSHAVHFDRLVIARHVLELNANEIIIAHSRTINDNEPNDHDAKATHSLAVFLSEFGCAILDHMIVSPKGVSQIGNKYPNATSRNREVDPTINPNAGAPPGMGGMLPPGMPPALAKILGQMLGLPENHVPDPTFPVINLGINFSTPETEEADTLRVIGEITKARDEIKAKREKGEMIGDGHLTISSPHGPIHISDDENIETLVRDAIVPLMKGEEPRREVPFVKDVVNQGDEPSLADLLKEDTE